VDPLPGTPPPEPLPQVKADHLDRADRAWRARIAGGSWKQAAAVAGYSDANAAMKGVRTAYGQTPRVDREALRNLWRERLEWAWRQVVTDMTDRRPGAVTAAVRVAGMAVALDGLAEPVRVDMAITDTFDRLTAELAANDLLPGPWPND
jgi:hypothetical protein